MARQGKPAPCLRLQSRRNQQEAEGSEGRVRMRNWENVTGREALRRFLPHNAPCSGVADWIPGKRLDSDPAPPFPDLSSGNRNTRSIHSFAKATERSIS